MCNLRFRQVSQLFRQYVIRIARSPSPVQRAAVSSYDFVVYVYDYTNRKHTQQSG